MGFSDIFKAFGEVFIKTITKFFSWDLIFGVGLTFFEKFLRFFGLVNFILTIGIAIYMGFNEGVTLPAKLLLSLIALSKTIILTDQGIFEVAKNFNMIAAPTLKQAIVTLFLIIQKSFYFIWWHRLFTYIIKNYSWAFPVSIIASMAGMSQDDKSQGVLDSKAKWIGFIVLCGFIVLSSMTYLIFLSHDIEFTFQSMEGVQGIKVVNVILNNIFNFINPLMQNWYHFIPFKGLGYYLLTGSFYKTILLFQGTDIAMDIMENATINLSNITG